MSIIARANLETFSQKTNTYGAKLSKTLLKNNIETKLCYLQIGEEWVSFIPENQKNIPNRVSVNRKNSYLY